MRMRTVFGRLAWLALVLALLALPSIAEEEDPAPPAEGAEESEEAEEAEDPVLEGEAKREHEKRVKALLKWLRSEKNQEVVRNRITELGARGTRIDRDALIAYVPRNKNHGFVSAAFSALADMGGKTVREFLVGKHALRSRNFLVAHSAAEALGWMEDKRAAKDLLEVMINKRSKIKVVGACAIALARCGGDDEEAVKALFKYSRHRKDTIRAYAVESLGYLATDAAVARLTEALQEDKLARVRAAGATGLGQTKRADALPALEKALAEDNSLQVREAAAYAARAIRRG